jgi:hypothetical protein
MKFRVTLKDPDCLYEAAREATREECAAIPGLSEEEKLVISQKREVDAITFASKKWFQYGEYVTIEIDTDEGTATVLKVE